MFSFNNDNQDNQEETLECYCEGCVFEKTSELSILYTEIVQGAESEVDLECLLFDLIEEAKALGVKATLYNDMLDKSDMLNILENSKNDIEDEEEEQETSFKLNIDPKQWKNKNLFE